MASTPDCGLLLVGQDGLLSLWSSKLKLKKNKALLEENKQPARTPKWIADTTLMPQYNKLVIGTCDRELRLYELSNFEPYFQITGLESLPLQLEYSYTGEDECILLYGDDQGCVNIILISNVGETLRNWSKCPPVEGIPSSYLDNICDGRQVSCIRWKVHNDWVTQIKYVHSIQSVISSSNDEHAALVIGSVKGSKTVLQRLKDMSERGSVRSSLCAQAASSPPRRLSSDESVFRAYKGVKAFDFCKQRNLLVSGGLDRTIRLWNPYIPGWPTGVMQGHNAPISFLYLCSEENRIYSVSTDNNVMVWSMEDQTCLANIISRASHIRGELAACCFSLQLGALCIATDSLAVLQLRHRAAEHSHSSSSHREAVLCCRYNTHLQLFVSCSQGSLVRIWDLNTGAMLSQFHCSHGGADVTCMALDNSGKRIITGGRDGSLKQWDCSNGDCVSVFRRGSDVADEVNSCMQVDIHNKRCIISVGCDRWISIFPDLQDGANGVQNLGRQWLHQEPYRHQDDIVSVDLWPPNLLATSSCGGEVLVWNLVSGLLFCQLSSLHCCPLSQPPDEDLNVCKVLFILSRASNHKTAATLVASGPGGCIHFWNIFGGGKLFGKFSGFPQKVPVVDLALGEGGSWLLSADHLGWLHIWDIADFAQHGPETSTPPLLYKWRAHSHSITSVEYVPKLQLTATSASDCLIRLWSCQGELIGTFGQKERWHVKDKETWSAELPEDLRSHTEGPVHQGPPGSTERPESRGLQTDSAGSHTQLTVCQGAVPPTGDRDIEEELRQPPYTRRARRDHLTHMSIPQVSGRLMTYHTLQCHELDDVCRDIRKPDPAAELHDPYDFSF
ncbi:cilia- and flagella-associated protein 337-like [Amia ocellicauda]|uniref:cilia- and flagella-associated protein 337-like n=1 Tax=Amia ocellicauda TaxID=2972642 RepID=UPI00346425B9